MTLTYHTWIHFGHVQHTQILLFWTSTSNIVLPPHHHPHHPSFLWKISVWTCCSIKRLCSLSLSQSPHPSLCISYVFTIVTFAWLRGYSLPCLAVDLQWLGHWGQIQCWEQEVRLWESDSLKSWLTEEKLPHVDCKIMCNFGVWFQKLSSSWPVSIWQFA